MSHSSFLARLLPRHCGLLPLIVLFSASSQAQVKPELVKEWQAATVFIEVRDGDAQGAPPSYGTGFVVREQGYVLTAAHVLNNLKNPIINGRTESRFGQLEPLQVVYMEQQYDIALLQFSNSAAIRPKLRIGNPWKLTPTSTLDAAGFPLGLDFSVRQGALISTGGLAGRWVTDMALGQGDSGGPVFNKDGEVVAIIQASIAGGDNLKVVRPMNFAKSLLTNIDVNVAALDSPQIPEVVSYTVAPTIASITSKGTGFKEFTAIFPAKTGYKIVDAQFEPKSLSLIKNPVSAVPTDGASVSLKFQVANDVPISKVKGQLATMGGDLVTKQLAK